MGSKLCGYCGAPLIKKWNRTRILWSVSLRTYVRYWRCPICGGIERIKVGRLGRWWGKRRPCNIRYKQTQEDFLSLLKRGGSYNGATLSLKEDSHGIK